MFTILIHDKKVFAPHSTKRNSVTMHLRRIPIKKRSFVTLSKTFRGPLPVECLSYKHCSLSQSTRATKYHREVINDSCQIK